jgi:BirA family biotin operon repressor/biotin-[acetyl-CoA-carboxylase] ligase
MEAEDHTASKDTRRPLDAEALCRAVVRPGGLWRSVEVIRSTGSTNADLLARAAAGAPEGVVLAAEEQTAGRGRMGRSWVSPPGAALTFSLLVRPAPVPSARLGWLPLLAGVAVAAAVTSVAGVQARLKWPNDVLAAEAKLAGILAEAAGVQAARPGAQAGPAVVIGIGLNVSAGPGELPPAGPGGLAPASLRTAGAAGPALRREPLLAAILDGFERRYLAWRRAGGDPQPSGLRAEYTARSGTIGRRVRAELPGSQLSGLAVGVDSDGRLLVRVSPGAELPVAAADLVHLR